jgi:hypothetical protein
VDPEHGGAREPRRPLERRRPERDNPARPYNRPPNARLFDLPGLLIVAGLAVAGLVFALILTRYVL